MADEAKAGEAPAVEQPVDIDKPEPAAKVETPVAVETKTDDTAAEPEKADEGEEPSEDGKKKHVPGSRKLKIRNDFLLQENSNLQRQVEELRGKGQGQARPEETKAPEEKDFPNDYIGFQVAKAAYDAGQTLLKKFDQEHERRTNETKAQREAEAVRERAVAHNERLEEAREVIADFDETLSKMQGVNVRPDVIEEVMGSDKSALLAYHLAKNPDKLRELNALSGRELAREVGRLEGSVRMPSAKRQTSAPPPPSQVKGGTSQPFDARTASMDDYVARRQAGWRG